MYVGLSTALQSYTHVLLRGSSSCPCARVLSVRPEGELAPCEQAKLWGLREALRKLEEPDDQYEWMSCQVRKAANGRATGGDHPSRDAVRKFFARVDRAAAVGEPWYPGMCLSPRTGRPVELTAQKKAAICKSMMSAKKRGYLPSYDLAVARCPSATLNSTTGRPFSRERINQTYYFVAQALVRVLASYLCVRKGS